MKRLTAVRAVGMLVLLCLPATTRAESTSCGNETIIPPDGRVYQSSIPAGTTFWFLFQTRLQRSYSVEVFAALDNAFPALAATVFNGTDGCGGTSTLVTTATTGTDPGEPFASTRVSFTAVDPGNGGFHRIRVVNSGGGALTYSISVSETTMFSTAWSTFGSYDSFYSLYNTTNSTITGTLTLFNTAGTAVTTQAVTINSAATASTNTAAMGTVRNTAGTAKFIHNGPPGAILAEAAIANFTISPTPYFQFIHFQSAREAAH
jgi:hypothetical protein